MKVFKFFILIIAFMAIGFASCKKDTGNSKVNVGSNKMSATIGNKNYDITITEINKIKKGDTVTIYFFGISKDSTIKINIGLLNQVGIFVKKYYFKGDPFDTISPVVYGGLDHVYPGTDSSYVIAGDSTKNFVNILEYNENTDILGSYSFSAKNSDDTSEVISVKGEFNGSLVDPQTKIPDLPVPFGRMTCRINNATKSFSAFAVSSTLSGLYTLNVTGTNNQENIILNFVNFKPSVGTTYPIDTIYLNTDTTVTASYIYNNKTYFADGSAGTSRKIKIVKMTTKSIQGTFNFVGIDQSDKKSTATITSGMFNAPFKNNY
jgi:hypothetical protein